MLRLAPFLVIAVVAASAVVTPSAVGSACGAAWTTVGAIPAWPAAAPVTVFPPSTAGAPRMPPAESCACAAEQTKNAGSAAMVMMERIVMTSPPC